MPGLCSESHHLHPPPGQQPLLEKITLTFARGNRALPCAKRARITTLDSALTALPAQPSIRRRIYFDTDDAQSLLAELAEGLHPELHETHARGRLTVEEYRKNNRLRSASDYVYNDIYRWVGGWLPCYVVMLALNCETGPQSTRLRLAVFCQIYWKHMRSNYFRNAACLDFEYRCSRHSR